MAPHSLLSLTLEGRLRDRMGVVSFRGVEEVNALYHLDVDFTTDATDDELEEALLYRPVTLSIHDDADVVRSFHGIADDIEAHGVFAHGRRAYRMRIVPRMALLEGRRTRRIWPNQSSLDIAAELFREHGFLLRPRVARVLPKRPYCVQYDETDYAFLTRIFAEDGLFFTFDHPRQAGGSHMMTSMGASEVVVVSDTAEYYAPIDGGEALRFERMRPGSAMTSREDHVIHFAPRSSIRPAGVRVHVYDPMRPTTRLRDEALRDPKAPALLEAIPPPREARTVTIFEGSYEDAIPAVPTGQTTRTVPTDASIRLEALRRKARVVDGASYCKRLSPGRKFALQDHELPGVDGSYVVMRVEHEGYSAEVIPPGRAPYQNRFVCAKSTVPLRPDVPPKPRAITDTGIVVGPPGQETHTDDLGRIHVRFTWDLSGRPAYQGTSWVRTGQLWAGAGFGAQFIPRVGMEVVVTYLDGDPDRPLVTGCVYNATHPVPFPLPGGATQSGIRTQSTPGGSGANEIRFEDARGKEQLILLAERDLIESVGRDREEVVGRNRSETVARDAEERVNGDMKVHVGGQFDMSVDGDRSERCSGDASMTVRGRDSRHVEGSASTVVDKGYSLHVAESCDVVVGTPGKGHYHGLMVHGDHIFGATDSIALRAEKKITLQCGGSVLELGRDGLKLDGKRIDLSGREGVSMKGPGPSLRLDEEAQVTAKTLRLFSSDASLVLDEHARIKGKQVRINCDEEKPIGADAAKKPVATVPFKLKLSDAEFGAYADKKFHLLVDGATYEGKTDGTGLLEKEVPEDAQSLTIVLWTGEYPTSEQKTWTIRMGAMPPASTPRGALLRLANLGYFAGEPKDEMDEAAKKAVRDFQAHAGLKDTGELDAATAGKLNALHGK